MSARRTFIDLCDDDDEEAPAAAAAASNSADVAFLQLRDQTNPERTWTISLLEMLEPAESVTHAMISTFGHTVEYFDIFRQTLKQHCPRLKKILIVSDWKNTGGIGGSAAGQVAVPMLPNGTTENPYYFVPDVPDDGVRYAFVFPRLADELLKEGANKGRFAHSIQHAKLLIVRHAEGVSSPAHLRVHIMSSNIDNVCSRKGGSGDVVWRSPMLEALPARDPSFVMPTSAVARRFGHPLLQMVKGFLEGALEKLDPPEARDLRHWADMLCGYRLEVPAGVTLVVSRPGTYPTRVARPLAPRELGLLGGRLMCWEYDKRMARNLDDLVGSIRRQLNMPDGQPTYCFESIQFPDGRVQNLIQLKPEPDNPHDPNALLVVLSVGKEERRLGRLSRRDAGGLSPLLLAGAVECSATLQVVVGKETTSTKKPTAQLADGMVELPKALVGSRWYVDVVVRLPEPQSELYTLSDSDDDDEPPTPQPSFGSAPIEDWLDLAAQLRCNLGLSRLREVLKSTGPWPLEERTALISMSASVGHKGITSFMRSFASACDDTVDIDAYDKRLLYEKLREHKLPVPEPLPCTQNHARCKSGECEHVKEPTALQLKQALRPVYQAVSTLPSLILPASNAPGALMCHLDAYDELEREHEQSSQRVLHDLDLASGASIHPRITSESDYRLKCRVTRAHSKFIMGIYETAGPGGAPFGWAYVGSHNFSPTSWGTPTSLSTGVDESVGLVQHSNWEAGVLLTVPRGTLAEEARKRMGFDTWPLPFDPTRLRPYGEAEKQRARDTFQMVPALRAQASGDPKWESMIPPDVKSRMEERELMEDITRAYANADHFDDGSGTDGVVGSASDDELAAGMRASLESEQDAEYKAALRASTCEQQRNEELELQAALRASRDEPKMPPRDEVKESAQMAAAIAASLNNGANSTTGGKRVTLPLADDDDEKGRMRAARLRRLESL